MRQHIGSLTAGLIVLLIGRAPRAEAQSDGAIAGYVALIVTPVGAFTPTVTSTTLGGAGGAQFGLRYGHSGCGECDLSYNSYNAILAFPVANGANLSLSLGAQRSSCDGCEALYMGGVRLDQRLATVGDPAATHLVTSIAGDIGFARPSDGAVSAFSGAVNLPISIVGDFGTTKIVPFVAPGIGYGRISGDGESMGGARGIVSGGIGFAGLGAFGVTAGFQKILMTGSTTQYGLSVSFGGR